MRSNLLFAFFLGAQYFQKAGLKNIYYLGKFTESFRYFLDSFLSGLVVYRGIG